MLNVDEKRETMTYYIIETAEPDKKTGVVSWKGEALNPKEAMLKLAEEIINNDFLKQDVSVKGKIRITEWILTSGEDADREIIIYPVANDADGEVQTYSPDDLSDMFTRRFSEPAQQ